MGQARVDRILLVWPNLSRKHTQSLSRRLDLVLMHRHASRLGAHLGVVTNDEDIVDHATELGIPVFNSIKEGHLFIWRSRRTLRPTFTPPPNKPPNLEQARLLLTPEATRPQPHPAWRLAIGALSLTIGLLSISVLYFLTIPAAKIVLTPTNQRITIDINLTADPTLTTTDYTRGLIPATTRSTIASASIEIPTTGSSQLSTNAAQGTVIFTNLTSEPIRVPAGTAVRTTVADPVRFVTQTDVELPGARGMIATATVHAVTPGPSGNVSPSLINRLEGPLQQFVAVTNRQSTSGGEHITIPSVTRTDRSNAYQAALPQLIISGYSDILAALPPHLISTPDSASLERVIETNYSHFAAEHADTLALDIRATINATILDDDDAYQAGLHLLKTTLGANMILMEDSIIYDRSQLMSSAENRSINFSVTATANAMPSIDPEFVVQLVRWSPVDEATNNLYANLSLAQPPQITLPPTWINRLPWLSWRTEVIFAHPNTTAQNDHTSH